MRIYGEAFLFINAWMDFLCLLLASRLIRCRFDARKALISAGFGAVYGAAAWAAGEPAFRTVPVMLLVCLGMALAAFGSRGIRLFPLIAAAGLMLSGLSDFVLKRGAAPASVIWIDGGITFFILLLTRQIRSAGDRYELRIKYKDRSAALPSLRDTGNLLADAVSGLPVIVIPKNLAGAFLPPETDVNDLSALPIGFRLIRAKTAAGNRTLMCFTPDQIVIRQGKRTFRVDAVIAVSDFEESRALLPNSLFCEQREEMCDAVL